MGISSANPHETLLVHLGVTKEFKGLVAYAKCNRDSYKSELGIYFPYFLFVFFDSLIVLLENEQNLSVVVFDQSKIDTILCLY